MGGRTSNSGMGSSTGGEFKLPEPKLKPGRPTKQSEEVFNDTYTRLRRLAREEIAVGRLDTFGYSGFEDDKYSRVFSKPMLAGMQSLIEAEWRRVENGEKRGWSTPETAQVQKYALRMLGNMVNRYYKNTYEDSI